MKKILLLFVIFCAFLSCQKKSDLENQIIADLVGMLHNKVEVKELSIKQISKTDNQTQTILFDCALNFTDNLYKDNGTLAFSKGTKVKESNNLFVYQQNGNILRLVKLEFGKSETVILGTK